jgi:hypothetical protein
MKTYRGYRDADGCHVFVHRDGDGWPRLRLRLDLANKSPTGFEWGYGGSGPGQLALALLADALDDDARALRLFMAFKWAVTAKLPRDVPWQLTSTEIIAKVVILEAMKGRQNAR